MRRALSAAGDGLTEPNLEYETYKIVTEDVTGEELLKVAQSVARKE